MLNKVISAEDAALTIQDSDTICTSGFVGIGTPDALLIALEKRFLETGSPRELTLVFAAGQGDGIDRGLNRLGHAGLLKRVIGGHWGLIPKVAALAIDGKIEAYNLPQGSISQLFRDIAAGKPGFLTRVGIGTFVDPRIEGGRINDVTTEALVEVMTVNDEEFLFYKAFPINVAFLRGTTADGAGNITMEREALTLDNLAMAMAAKNSDGIVITQVERSAANGSLNPREVVIPGVMVDCVVEAPQEHHWQTYATPYSPALSGELKVSTGQLPTMPLNIRKVIARRCAFELPPNGIVNLGIGVPEGIAAVAAEENLLDLITLTAEPGVIGGLPASGLDFGAGINTDAIIDQNQQFDFYDGGGLDLACLGMAECDRVGNINVSRFGNKLAGAGGFINISQNARRVIFAGTFTAGGLDAVVQDGKLLIKQEGSTSKFIDKVRQVTFSGKISSERNQSVLYVTERCVFELSESNLKLIEIAPGIDLHRDILAHMDFVPCCENIREMNAAIFQEAPMKLKETFLDLCMDNRVSYDPECNTLFLNFENVHLRQVDDIEKIKNSVEIICREIGRRVDVIANYESFSIDHHLDRGYGQMVRALEEKYYGKVTRYTANAFMRVKLGKMLTSIS